MNPDNYLSAEEEKAHYSCHNNNPEDKGYQNFVSPVVNAILSDFGPEHSGLDFGSGTGSPIMKMLQDAGYSIEEYDLFFYNHSELLQKQYDYIACSEVVEHFKEPYQEFTLLKSLLKPGGKLYVMTLLWDETTDFANWHYKNDHTHVFLYHTKAFKWIKNNFGYTNVEIGKRLVILEL